MYTAIAIIAALILSVIFLYNNLVKQRLLVREAFSAIDVFLKKRHDLIPNLVETVKGYAKHESTVLQEVTNARINAITAKTIEEKSEAEKNLQNSLVKISAVAENYPDLKANQNYLQLQSQLQDLENNLESARRYYNGTVRNYNGSTQSFPSNIMAKIFGFNDEAFFSIENPSEKELPKVSF